jgi:hypothetical protein
LAIDPEEHGHLTSSLLDQYLTGERSALDVLRHAAEHLELTCDACRAGLPAEPERMERLIAAAGAGLRTTLDELTLERSEAPAVARELAALPEHEALLRAVSDRRCHTLPWVEHHLLVAGLALDRGLVGAAEEALTLVAVVLPRIELARYGSSLLREAEADAWILQARCHLAKGELEPAERALGNARALGEAYGGSPLLEADLLFARGGLAVARRRDTEARERFRALAARVSELGALPALPGVVTATAWMERRLGRPAVAAARLTGFFDEWREPPIAADEWWAARELISALCELGGDREQAARQGVVYLATWSLPESGAGGGRALPGLEREAQLRYLEGLFCHRIGGESVKAERALVRARNLFLHEGRGVDAAHAALELARLHLEAGDVELARRVAADLEPVALCPDVQGATLAVLARFAERLFRAKVAPEELHTVEDFLLRARAGWLAAAEDHGPP